MLVNIVARTHHAPDIMVLNIVSPYSMIEMPLQGNCSSGPNLATGDKGAPLLDFLPRQCLIASDVNLLYTPNGNLLWIDRLYVRLQGSVRTNNQTANQLVSGGAIYITNSTFQGDGVTEADGVNALVGRAYVEGATFEHND